jgi:hypothetical protein
VSVDFAVSKSVCEAIFEQMTGQVRLITSVSFVE